MQENIQNYTESELKFSSSKLYFQHQNQILQNFGFVSPMSIDIHFKYTFQEIKPNYFIEGGEFEGITVDHDVHEQGIIYKIGFLKPKYQNVEHISLDLKKNFDNSSVRPLLGGFLGWVIVFVVLYLLYDKGKIWVILFWLNVIGGGILFGYLMWKVLKAFYNKSFKTKKVDYSGLSVNYVNNTDALMLSQDLIRDLQYMGKNFWIVKFCYTGNCVYLLQDIHDRYGEKLSSTSKLYSEQEKANLQEKTMSYINNSEFLSNFISK